MTVSRLLSLTVALAVLLGSGGMYVSLAKDSEQLDVAVTRLARVPLEVGDWKAMNVAPSETDDRVFDQAGAKGYWVRTYVHQRTRQSVLAILMCGRAGKMAVHTPDVCYRGAGFELDDVPSVCAFPAEQGETASRFWAGQFTKKAGMTTTLRLYWAWNARGVWEASANPRWRFRGEPFLYKLYVSRDLSQGGNVAPQEDPAADFLRLLLPELNLSLFPPEKGGAI